jgi:hypothetical protein
VSAIEYALGLSFLAVACLGVIGWLEDSSSDELAARGNSIGTPDLDEPFGSSTSTSAASSTSSSTTPPPPPAPPVAVITSSLNPHNGNSCAGSKWTPTVVVTVTDEFGAPVFNAAVSATWVLHPSDGTANVSFATKQDGTATFSLHNLEARQGQPGYVESVTFTINSVTPDGGAPFILNPPLSTIINEEPCT